jgi:nucleoid-associated protein
MIDNIVSVAVHDLRKDSGATKATVEFGPDKLPVKGTVTRVVNELHTQYGRKVSKAHGKFSSNIVDYPSQGFISEFHDGEYKDFRTLTHELMTTLSVKAGAKASATGGHVLFAHFEHDKQTFLMVAIITDRLGAQLTKALRLEDVQHLDLDGFRYAGRVNISAWKDGADRYIGFLKGSGDVARYFEEFLGCEVATQQREDTARLINALESFAAEPHASIKNAGEFLQKAHDILARSSAERRELDFATFTNELLPESVEDLREHLADPKKSLSDGFVPDRREFSQLVSVKAKTKNWSVEFSRKAVATGEILYNAERKTLTLKNLPPELVGELEKIGTER